MEKFTKEFTRLKAKDCNFFFYTTSGSYGMYCRQIRHNLFCIPYKEIFATLNLDLRYDE